MDWPETFTIFSDFDIHHPPRFPDFRLKPIGHSPFFQICLAWHSPFVSARQIGLFWRLSFSQIVNTGHTLSHTSVAWKSKSSEIEGGHWAPDLGPNFTIMAFIHQPLLQTQKLIFTGLLNWMLIPPFLIAFPHFLCFKGFSQCRSFASLWITNCPTFNNCIHRSLWCQSILIFFSCHFVFGGTSCILLHPWNVLKAQVIVAHYILLGMIPKYSSGVIVAISLGGRIFYSSQFLLCSLIFPSPSTATSSTLSQIHPGKHFFFHFSEMKASIWFVVLF